MTPEEELEEKEVEGPVDELAKSFDPRWRADFEGLMYLGHLEHSVERLGHKFVLKTLTVGDHIQVNQVCKEFEDSVALARATKTALVAASLLSVDNKPLVVASKQVGVIRQKFEYIINTWYDPVIEALYAEYKNLEDRMWEIVTELGTDTEQEKKVAILDGEVERTS